MRNLLSVTALFLAFTLPTSAQHSNETPLSTLADCTAFATTLHSYYSDYREATDDRQFLDAEARAEAIRDVWVSLLYRRMEGELDQQRDVDTVNAQMRWIYEASEKLPDAAGYGNAVVIFENRVGACLRDLE